MENKDLQPTGLAFEDIEQLAEKAREKLGYDPEKGDLDSIMEHIGGKIKYDFWPRDLERDGSIDIRGEGDFTVFLPTYTARAHQRYTLAHELGHYILHSRCGQCKGRMPRYRDAEIEYEADVFARAFLVPREEAMKVPVTYASLASKCQVPIVVAEQRLTDLLYGDTP